MRREDRTTVGRDRGELPEAIGDPVCARVGASSVILGLDACPVPRTKRSTGAHRGRRLDFLVCSFAAALRLIGSFSPDVVDAVRTSLSVSAGATVFAALFGVPVGLAVGLSDSGGKGSP